MYDCPNCAGNLQFDIQTQKMKCVNCNTLIDPYKLEDIKGMADERAADEFDEEFNEEYEVTMFSCPQCGAKIYSMDTQAAGFCSFCGSTTVLNSRLERVVRPKYIVPFRITKNRCVDIFRNYMKKSKFIPKELRDEHAIESFRGIYLPFWVYKTKQEDMVSFKAVQYRDELRGKMKYTYKVSGYLDCDYYGAVHDASAAFEDDISEQLLPYDLDKFQKFTPAFLSGFYADIADVDPGVYGQYIANVISKVTVENLKKHPMMQGYLVGDDPWEKFDFKTRIVDAQLVMLPVWLLSYRKGNRIAYIAVNGLTGKIAADMPISPAKYIIESFILSLPVFGAVKLLLTATNHTDFSQLGIRAFGYIVAWLAVMVMYIYTSNMYWIWERSNRFGDLGKDYVQKGEYGFIEKWSPILRKEKTDGLINKITWLLSSTCCIGAIGVGLTSLSDFVIGGYNIVFLLFGLSLITGALGVSIVGLRFIMRIEAKRKIVGYMIALLGIIGPLAVYWIPVKDSLMYLTIFISGLCGIYSFMDIIGRYNILCTRKLPQYQYRGGDHYV